MLLRRKQAVTALEVMLLKLKVFINLNETPGITWKFTTLLLSPLKQREEHQSMRFKHTSKPFVKYWILHYTEITSLLLHLP